MADEYPACRQPIHAGSCVVVPGTPDLGALPGFTVLALIWPTLPDRGLQAILSQWLAEVGCGFMLHIDAGGHLAATLGDGYGSCETVRSHHVLAPRTWYRRCGDLRPHHESHSTPQGTAPCLAG